MRLLTLILSAGLGYSLTFGKTYSAVISDSTIISFMGWEIKSTEGYSEKPVVSSKRNIHFRMMNWDTLNFIMPDAIKDYDLLVRIMYLYNDKNGLDTIFDQKDRDFLFYQFANISDTVWQHPFPKSRLIDKQNKKQPNHYYYSVPLFSKDMKYVIVKREYYCGSLCAHGGYFIYRRLGKDNWEFVKLINGWVS